MLLFLALIVAVASAAECDFPLTGNGECTYSENTNGDEEFDVTFVNDVRFPSCMSIHYEVVSGDDFVFTYDLHDEYELVWVASELYLTIINGENTVEECDSAFRPSSFFMTFAIFALCILLGVPSGVKKGVLFICILALLPVAFNCYTGASISTITIGVPSRLVDNGWRSDITSYGYSQTDDIDVYVDDNEGLESCDYGNGNGNGDDVSVVSCASGSVDSDCDCGTVTCPTGCATCSANGFTCNTCLSGYYLAAGQCFDECTPACTGTTRCVSGFCVGTGALFFTVAWEIPGDGDLYVTDPNGDTISWVITTSPSGGFLDHDDQSGRGPENVYWNTNPPAGVYRVCIDDYEGTTLDFEIPQTVTYYLNSATPLTKVITAPVTDLHTGDVTEGNPCTVTSNGYLGSYTV